MKAIILEVIGAGIFLGGIWWIWPPVTLIVAGILVILVAQGMVKKETRE